MTWWFREHGEIGEEWATLANYHIRTNQQHKRMTVSLELRRSSLPVASAMRGDMRVLLELSSAPQRAPLLLPPRLCACVERESPPRIVDRIPARRRGNDTVPRRTVTPTYIRKHEGYRPNRRGKISHPRAQEPGNPDRLEALDAPGVPMRDTHLRNMNLRG